MKIALHEFFPAFKEKMYRAFLLYGNKPDLIENILNEVKDLDVRFIRTQDAEFWDHYVTLCSPTLFNVGRTVIVIEEVSEGKFSAYQSILNTLPETIHLIFTSSQFRKHTVWVQNFQKSSVWGLVPSYEVSLDQSIIILKRCLAAHDVSLSGNHIKIVAQWIQEGDWVSTAKTIHLLCQTNNNHPLQQEDLEGVFHYLVLNSEEIFLPLLHTPDMSIITTLRYNDQKLKWVRAWQKLAWQCWQLKVLLEQYTKTHKEPKGSARAQHITTLATQLDPPIFFKHLPFILQNIDTWSLGFLEQRMNALYDLEINIKKETFRDNDNISVFRMMYTD
ncbi:hypothetical protein [Holospora curviuscula]|uniref:DNA polymerase III subunit delta n=1 Tax=Holospora curviuscula TaxID=1082868 RepID=A0A2S5RA33_9PROT|nr:hypothetical protein [Holospora curviuscula]PPE04189.1 hypothetical protein HCUR_00380 [Holospora curviuscula]